MLFVLCSALNWVLETNAYWINEQKPETAKSSHLYLWCDSKDNGMSETRRDKFMILRKKDFWPDIVGTDRFKSELKQCWNSSLNKHIVIQLQGEGQLWIEFLLSAEDESSWTFF